MAPFRSSTLPLSRSIPLTTCSFELSGHLEIVDGNGLFVRALTVENLWASTLSVKSSFTIAHPVMPEAPNTRACFPPSIVFAVIDKSNCGNSARMVGFEQKIVSDIA